MLAKEFSSIASLLNEDSNFCSNTFPQETHEISSWSMHPSKNNSKIPSKPQKFSLPPIKIQQFLSQPSNTFSLTPAPVLPSVTSSQKKAEKINRLKLNELKSLETFNDRIIPASNEIQLQFFHPHQTKSLKKSEKGGGCSVKNSKDSEFSQFHNKRRKKAKMVIGLVYPMEFYQKFFIGNQFLLGANERRKKVEVSNLSRNEGYKEIIKKVTATGLRSQSMFVENIERLINKSVLQSL